MKLKHLFLFAFIIALPILILAFTPYKTLVRIEAEVSEISFTTLEPLENFFSFENSFEKIKRISVQSYDSLFYYSEGYRDKKASIISSDITDKITFYNTGINSIPINKNSSISIRSNKYDLKKYIIQITGNKASIEFKSNNDTLNLKVNNEPVQKVLNSSDNIAVITPSQKMLKMFITVNETSSLEEEEVIKSNNITFQKNINGKSYSSIKSGKIELVDIGKVYPLTQNSLVNFNPNTELNIMELNIKNGKIHIILEGFTNKILYGLNRKNIAPNLLFYLINNNFLLTLINTFLVILTFFISIIKFKNAAK